MTWVRTEDDMPLHPKHLRLSDGAYRLWSNGLHFANRATTDGRIDKALVATLNHHGRWTLKQVAGFVSELVAVVQPYHEGLWIDAGDHYLIHDYEHHQAEAMKERVERKREYERDKKRDQRRDRDRGTRGSPIGVPSVVPTVVPTGQPPGHPEGIPPVSRGVSSVPTRPDPRESAIALSASAREEPPAVPARDPSRPVPKHIARFEASLQPAAPATSDSLSIGDVECEFSELRKASGGGGYKNRGHRDDDHLAAIAADANESGTTRLERMTALRETIGGFLADENARKNGAPIGWLASDPARYRARVQLVASSPVDVLRDAYGAAERAYDAALKRDASAEELNDLAQKRADALAAFHGAAA